MRWVVEDAVSGWNQGGDFLPSFALQMIAWRD